MLALINDRGIAILQPSSTNSIAKPTIQFVDVKHKVAVLKKRYIHRGNLWFRSENAVAVNANIILSAPNPKDSGMGNQNTNDALVTAKTAKTMESTRRSPRTRKHTKNAAIQVAATNAKRMLIAPSALSCMTFRNA
jgi:hypothetical protein